MPKNLSLIIASHNDSAELASFNKSLIDDGGSNNNMSTSELEMRMKRFLSDEYLAIIFEVEGKRIGYALINKSACPVFIRHFFISKENRRKGYGKEAFNQIIRLLDVDEVDLNVLYSNSEGYQFWGSCGLAPYEIHMQYRKNSKNNVNTNYSQKNDSF
jgi:hypothetical protein